MKFQIEFLEITKGFRRFKQETALKLADMVCAGEITRAQARKLTEWNVHYHGSPMWGNVDIGEGKKIWCGEVLYKNSCALISFAHWRYRQDKKIIPLARSLIFDCGAFTFYMAGIKTDDVFWAKYYACVLAYLSRIDWFIIPDVIGGSEQENDRLIDNVPVSIKHKGVPVWHSDESLERLGRLCKQFDRVCIGLIKPHKPATSKIATQILKNVFTYLYIENDYKTKIHGLAMLDGRVLGSFPFDSADSSFVATNVPKTDMQIPEIKCKLARTAILKNKIEVVTPPSIEDWVKGQSVGQLDLLLL